jgi:type IV secretory pathway VirB10-like protein
MFPKSLILGVLALACVVAAAGGGYLATRQHAYPNTSTALDRVPTSDAKAQSPVPWAPAAPDSGSRAAAVPAPAPTPTAPPPAPRQSIRVRPNRESRKPASTARPADAPEAALSPARLPDVAPATPPLTSAPPAAAELVAEPEPTALELIVPADAVLGLEIANTVTSDRANVEDRVEARLTRDVRVGERVAIPAGSRVLGSVTDVDRGGKLKASARLAVRFHAVVLPDGVNAPIGTETVFRLGPSPAAKSAAKIGGGAVGGAILGAIIGGRKGAVIGGSVGAAGGTAAVMAGDAEAATLPAGSVLSVRLTGPVAVTVAR